METNDVTVENIEKLYIYLKEKNSQKIKNIDFNISQREAFMEDIEDENRINEIKDEIEGLKKYKEQYEEKLNTIEELNMFCNDLKEIEKQMAESKQQIEQIEQEENSIDLNDEDAPSNLYDLSERKKIVQKSLEGLEWDRKGTIGIILANYENELTNLPESMKYFSTITNLELSLENANDAQNIISKKIDVLRERISEKGIELSENNLYDLSKLKGNDAKLAQRYNDMVNQLSEFDYEKKYYNMQINSLKELSDIENQIDKLNKDDNIKKEELSNVRKEIMLKVTETQNKYNNKESLQEEPIEQQIVENNNSNSKQEKNKKTKEYKNNINYHYSSDKLNSIFQNKKEELKNNKDELENEINEILKQFESDDIDIYDEEQYKDNDELVLLKEKFDELNENLDDINDNIEQLENSDILEKIQDLKSKENKIQEIDEEIEFIKSEIEKYNEILENEDIEEGSEEKIDAQKQIEKLTLAKKKHVDNKKSIIEQKDELYKYVNRKINSKKKEISKNKKDKSVSDEEGYWIFPNNSNPQEETVETNNSNNVINSVEQVSANDNQENSLVVTTGNVIEDYSKADNKLRNSLYLSQDFNKLVKDLKAARGLRSITKNQKALLKNAIESHGEEISKDLHGMQPEVLTNIVKDIYGNDTEFLNKYISKDITTGNDIINYGLYCDLYGESVGRVEKLKSLEYMKPKSIEFINNLFDKYYEKIQNGEIEENSSLDIQFKKMIANPVKFGIISSYNKDIQKPFMFRLNKIKMLFSKQAKRHSEKVDNICANIKLNEERIARSNKTENKNDRLGLGNSVEKNPPPIDKSNQKEAATKNIDSQQI